MNIVITGASKGIGKAVAMKFASDNKGHRFFLCSRNDDQLKVVAEDLLKSSPGNSVFTKASDLSKLEELRSFGSWILENADHVDILVNNAGIFFPGNVHDEANGVLEETLQINLLAPYHLTRLLLPSMIKQKSGHIFNISSIAGLQAYPGGGSYSISKFALDGFSKNLRQEMRPHGIKVTAVFPGAAYTDSWSRSGIDPDRFMKAEDIADIIVAASLLSPQACVEDIILRPQLGDI